MKEQVSALMDDEFDGRAREALFAALKHDGELMECWSIYHLIGDAMRGTGYVNVTLRQRLMARLENEPVVFAPRASIKSRMPLLMSLAASFAAVLFVGWMVLQQKTPHDVAPMATLAQNNVSAESVNAYLLAHHEMSPESGMQTAYYVRPVAYPVSDR